MTESVWLLLEKKLHWLQIKIFVLPRKAHNEIGPKYLSALLDNTRSVDSNLLKILLTKLVTCGDRAFQKTRPTLWNDLPTIIGNIDSLTSFKTKLKTHLFTKYYKT